MKTYLETGATGPHILNLDTRRTWVVSPTSQSLYALEKSLRYPLGKWLVGPQGRFGRGD